MPWKYRKLISNIGTSSRRWSATTEIGVAGHRCRGGGARVLDAAGIRYTSEAEETAARAAGFTMKPVPGVPEFVGGSTWQSLQRGTGNIETDYLNGEIVIIARRLGIEAPINERLATLARRAAATGAKPATQAPSSSRHSCRASALRQESGA